MSEEGSRLGRILRETAADMTAELNKLRAGFNHGAIKGDGAEEMVRQFLRAHLPNSLGVTSGQAVDSTGAISSQLDVIVYDALRTPMLFTSRDGHHLVPIEGVIAVIEVKAHLKKEHLAGILANCLSAKGLSRTAYLRTSFSARRSVYGAEWTDLPILYSVFAFESDNMYAGALNELQAHQPLHERIDNLCYLDRGVNLNVSMNWDTNEPAYAATVSPGGGLIDIAAEDRALVLWYAAFSTMVMQCETRPIDLTQYLTGELQAKGTMPAGPLVDAMRDEGVRATARNVGVNSEILLKVMNQEALSFAEVVEVYRGGLELGMPEGAPAAELMLRERAKQEAARRGPLPRQE